jgi:hypothetical protein
LVVTLLVGLAFCAGYAPVAQATTITVTNLNDSGPGSLRQAILDANSSLGLDTIDFDASLTGGTITLTSGNLSMTDDLNIFGLGSANLTVSGNNSSNVFRILDNPSVVVQIDGLTIRGGRSGAGGAISNRGMLTVTNSTISSNSADIGGGIYNEDGTLTVSNSIISGNVAEYDPGGGIYNKGGTVSVTDSIVIGNIADGRGGGIFHGANQFGQAGPLTIANSIISDNVGGDGGGIYNGDRTLTVSNSTISGNVGRDGGGIYGGFFGDSTINSSTISGNTAETGGGIRGANLTIQNSTMSENTARAGGGIFALGISTVTNSTISNNIATGNGVFANGGGILLGVGNALTVANSTISGNMAADGGGGICNGCTSGTPGTNLSLISSIVANNNAPTGPDLFNNSFGLIILAEANLIGVSADSDIPCGSQGNLCDIAALLGPLQNNGGSTETHALLLGSPAIDAGSPDCPPPATDQLGNPRVDGDNDGFIFCDIGAIEFQLQIEDAPDGGDGGGGGGGGG